MYSQCLPPLPLLVDPIHNSCTQRMLARKWAHSFLFLQALQKVAKLGEESVLPTHLPGSGLREWKWLPDGIEDTIYAPKAASVANPPVHDVTSVDLKIQSQVLNMACKEIKHTPMVYCSTKPSLLKFKLHA